MRSRKPRSKGMSEEALIALEKLATEHGVPDAQRWKENLTGDGDPAIEHVTTYWQSILSSEDSAITEKLLAEIPVLAAKYPSSSDYEGKLRPGITLVEDPKVFKATLRTSQPPRPVVEWGDLPISKY